MSDAAVLLFGATNAVGPYLLAQSAQPVLALSRKPQTQPSRHQWRQSDFARFQPQSTPQCILNCSALDALVDWLMRTQCRPAQIVALSSLSAVWKLTSPDAGERALVERLLAAETALTHYCRKHRIQLVVLRASLIWGAGRDHSLTPMARLAQRWRLLPSPALEGGARAPIHGRDLAACMLAALMQRQPMLQLAIQGGEVLSMKALLQRVASSVKASTIPLPNFCVETGLQLGRRLGIASGTGAWHRYRQAQVIEDGGDAHQLGVCPAGFRPQVEDWQLTPLS